MFSIVVRDDDGLREVALLGERINVGRGLDNHVVLKTGAVSRRHLSFVRVGFRWFAEDQGSGSGFHVNGRKAVRHELRSGDRLYVGGYPHPLEVREHELDREQAGVYAALQLATDEQRLVHADALEMKGELDLANWVRLEGELRRHAVGSAEHAHAQHELGELSKKVMPHWRALVAHGPIEGCSRTACPAEWTKLTLGTKPRVRRCSTCSADVTYCDTVAEALELFGSRVVVDPGRERRPGDIVPRPPLMPVG